MLMNWLSGTKTYLAGPVEHDEDAVDWRNELKKELASYNIEVYDPLIKPRWIEHNGNYDVPTFFSGIKRALKTGLDSPDLHTLLQRQHYDRHICLRCVSTADFIICRLPRKFTAGTFEELTIASQQRKPVLIYGPDGIASLWTMSLFDYLPPKDVFFDTSESVLQYLKTINSGEAEIDPLAWINLTYNKSYPKPRT